MINFNFNKTNKIPKVSSAIFRNSKKGMAVNTVFYIFMSVVMIALIAFGFQKIFLVSDELGEVERVEVQNMLIEKFESCDDPLNRGNKEFIDLKNQKFNSVCFLGADYETSSISGSLNNYEEFKAIGDGGDNVVLFKSVLSGTTLVSNEIISSLNIETDITNSFCYFPEDNTNDFYFELSCE